MKLFGWFRKPDQLWERNKVLKHENELLEEAMVRIKLENRAYNIENGEASNRIVKLKCEKNNLIRALNLDNRIKRAQRQQWARENAPELLEKEDV